MALPLLLAAGAGILGGAQYLMKKYDQREANQSFLALQGQLQNSALAPSTQDQILATAQSMLDNDSFFNRQSVNSQMQKLQNYSVVAHEDAMAAARAQQNNWMNQMRADSLSINNQLDQDYRNDLRDFAPFQDSYRKAMNALQGNNSADAVALLYQFFQLNEPGGVVRDGESGAFYGIGGTGQRFANWLNKIQGEGLSSTTARDIGEAIGRLYQPRYERALRQKTMYEQDVQRYLDQGYNVFSPVGRLGIDYGASPQALGVPPMLDPASQNATGLVEDATDSFNATMRSLLDQGWKIVDGPG